MHNKIIVLVLVIFFTLENDHFETDNVNPVFLFFLFFIVLSSKVDINKLEAETNH